DVVSSPTFVLIHEYQANLPIFHFDVYRLKRPSEFEALGAQEYFQAGGVCLVEWADRVADCLPEDSWIIRLEMDREDPNRRMLIIDAPSLILDALYARLRSESRL